MDIIRVGRDVCGSDGDGAIVRNRDHHGGHGIRRRNPPDNDDLRSEKYVYASMDSIEREHYIDIGGDEDHIRASHAGSIG